MAIRTGNLNVLSLLSEALTAVALMPLCLAPALAGSTWKQSLANGDRHIVSQEYSVAEECYRQALVEVKRGPHSADDVAECLQKVASTLQLEDRTNEVVPIYEKALRILQRAHGRRSPTLVPPLYALGLIFELEGDPKLAIKRYRLALAIDQKNFGPLSLEVSDSLHRLARANVGAHVLPEAESEYMMALSILMRQQSLPGSTELESLLSDYIDLLKKLDIPNKILVSDFQMKMLENRLSAPNLNVELPRSNWQKQVAALLTTTKGDGANHRNDESAPGLPLRGLPVPGIQLQSPQAPQPLGHAPANQKFQTQEKDFYERMIAIDIKTLGANHPAVADDLNALASFYVSRHRYAEAKPLLTRALAIYEAVYGPNNLLVTRTRTALAYIATDWQNSERATIVYSDSSSLAKIPAQAKSLEIARRLNELGFICYCQGKLDAASTIYHWALASTTSATGNDSILSAACLNDFAKVLLSLGQTKEAHQMQDTANAITARSQLAQNIRLF